MSTTLRTVILFVMCVGFLTRVSAQNASKVVTGTVYDEKGITLPGVGVMVKGTSIATSTNIDGKYSITVPASGTVLVYSFIGSTSQEITIGSKTLINVNLKSASTALSDVVVIGYGTQKRQDVNGSVSSVLAKDIANVPQPSLDQLIQGKAAGVTITQNSGGPGSATSVRIRGITSFGGSEPLYVIDGVPIQGDATNKSGNGRSPQLTRTGGGQEETGVSPLSRINPSDIESIDILKDASATAIYGSRGANGVVIVTTKRGKNGSAKISYDGYYGFQEQGKFLDMMDLKQFANLQNALADKFGQQRRVEFADPSILGTGTNWQDAIFQTAPQQNHQLSFSGGKDGVDYYVSGGYLKQEGTIIGSDFKRYSFRTNVNGQVKDWLKIGSTIGAARTNQNIGLGSNTGIVYNALSSAPDNPIYNADGSYAGPTLDAGGLAQGTVNPVAQALSLTNTLLSNNINGSAYADLKIYKDLSLRSELNGDFNWSEAQTFKPTYQWGAFSNQTARLDQYNSNSTYWGWKEYLNYSHTFGTKHNLTALAGYEVWQATWGGVSNKIENFASGNTIQTLGFGDQTTALIDQNKGSQVMESFLGRAIYTYNNRYSITASIRSDKSSKFAEGHKVGYFPAAAVSWRLSEESFMESTKSVIDNIKIRLNYGETGNQNIPNYLYGSSIKAVATGLGTGFVTNNVANLDLTWESAIQKGAGVDFSLFKGRIDASFDYYIKNSKNFLFQKPLPAFLLGGSAEYSDVAAIKSPYYNAGQIENKGFEFSINTKNIVNQNFKWNTTLIFSKYKNNVVSLNGSPALIGSINSSFISLPVTKTTEGGPVGEFFGYKVKGVIKNAADLQYIASHPQNVTGGTSPAVITNDPAIANSIYLGDLMYEDTNGDGKVDANDQVALGNPNPDFTYSITNNFTYKNFDLSIFLNGSYGGKILNALNYQIAGLSGLYTNQLASSSNFWSPSNPTSDIPAPKGGIANNNLVMSDRFLESASFLRIQNVRLGYNFPEKWIKHAKLSRLNVFASGQNLYVFTKYSGLDPEIGSLNQNPIYSNIDMGRYPIPRTITFGVNAQF
ncbi:SusC/RagA family protein [Pedobacter yonginense]|uniref:SusC/RagA family protein n=1 Tax=Pedobacter yonginense TaxID=651869 RepID=A0A317EMF0_9SPHI|nr:TonB-dependent receptor [Pedobacter yonginense]PWS26218.1 SusC/RagA family protein [Pedobacter yonginense]